MNIIGITPRRAIPQIIDALLAQESVMLWGPTGCAKSAVGREISRIAFDGNIIDVRLAQMEPADLHLPVPNIEERLIDWLPTSRIPNAKRHGERGLLLLDEITSAPPANAAVGYQLALDRCIGDTHIPEGWGILAAGNRMSDKGVTYVMPSPLANRFIHFEFDPNNADNRMEWVNDFVAYCAEHDVNPLVPAYIQFDPDALYQAPKNGDVAFPTLRSWEFLGHALDRAEKRGAEAPEETIIGRVGVVKGRAFVAFMAHRHEVPTAEEIIGNPKKAKCPTAKQLGAAFFVVAMLARYVTGGNFAAISTYLSRLPSEIDAAAVGMMPEKTRNEILRTNAGKDWLMRVQHLLA